MAEACGEARNETVSEATTPPLPAPPPGYAERMPCQHEATVLVEAGPDGFGRSLRLAPEAAAAWAAMRAAAADAGVRLVSLSGFRSVARQREIVQRKLAAGVSWAEILRVNAFPGHSEHHTGRALDLGSPDCEHLSERFEATREFQWLEANARRFGFALSYPRDGASGVAYEPWHWLWRPELRAGAAPGGSR